MPANAADTLASFFIEMLIRSSRPDGSTLAEPYSFFTLVINHGADMCFTTAAGYRGRSSFTFYRLFRGDPGTGSGRGAATNTERLRARAPAFMRHRITGIQLQPSSGFTGFG